MSGPMNTPFYGAMQSPPQGLDPRGLQPSMNVPDLKQYAESAKWRQTSVYDPVLLLPHEPNVSIVLRMRIITKTFANANDTYRETLQFDTPTTIYAVSAGTFYTDITTDMAVGTQVFWQALNTFTIKLSRVNGGELLTTAEGLGGSICGTAQFPAMIGCGGWMFNNGGSLLVNMTSLVDDQRVDVNLWTCEIRGPANYTWPSMR